MLKDWLKLLYLKSITVAQKRALVNVFGSPTSIFEADQSSLQHTELLSPPLIARILNCNDHVNHALISGDIEILESYQSHYIGFNHPAFPSILNEIPSPPLGLFVRGNSRLLQTPQIAIVGSRNASPGGRKTARAFSAELSKLGLTITSGLATGIDSESHLGCLAENNHTIAVIGTGIDRVYPKSNQRLFNEIAKKGLIVSEFPPGTQPLPGNFPSRNRIISGLSLGTVVVEAGIRSGSLITARLAAEQGREVFAIPGSIHMITSRGCHFLIRQGAKLVESIQDIVEELHHFELPMQEIPGANTQSSTIEPENPLYKLIDYAPTSIEYLIEQSGLTAEEVSSILVGMELNGVIAETAEGYLRLS